MFDMSSEHATRTNLRFHQATCLPTSINPYGRIFIGCSWATFFNAKIIIGSILVLFFSMTTIIRSILGRYGDCTIYIYQCSAYLLNLIRFHIYYYIYFNISDGLYRYLEKIRWHAYYGTKLFYDLALDILESGARQWRAACPYWCWKNTWY